MATDDLDAKDTEDRDAILKRRGRLVRIALTGLATATMASCGPCLSLAAPDEGQEQDTQGSDRSEGPDDPGGPAESGGGETGADPEPVDPEPIACLSVEAPSE